MKDTQQQPQLADLRFRLLVEAITDYAIYMLEPDGTVASWNAGAERFKGYKGDEIIGQNFALFFTPDDIETKLPQRILDIAKTEGRIETEGWRVRKDGTRFWTHVIVDAIRNPGGDLLGFAKITRDLTERRAAAMELKTSEEQFRVLVQGVTDYAIYMLDPNGKITSWNAGAKRIKQYAADEIIGQHFSRFYTEEDRTAAEPERALGIARAEGRYEKQGFRVRKDGTFFTANVILERITNEDGELLGFATVTRDVTERVEAQRSLEAAREAFLQSQKVEALGQLTGGVAHDFNNLLSVLLGSLELASKRVKDDPTTKRLLDNALQAVRRGSSLTQRMLAFARRQELSVEPVEVHRLVIDIDDLLQKTLGPSVTLVTDFPANLPAVLADSNQLELAILNLVVNARDAMPEGGLITVSASHEAPLQGFAEGAVRVSVADTGQGMDDATLQRAVEPFFTTKGIGKGTGLGLSMIKGFVEQLGGSLHIRSEVGRGTVVEMLLRTAPAAHVVAERAASAFDDQVIGPLRILAVDDDPLILMNTVAMLEDLGHAVEEASSGQAAFEFLQTERVDLVITDHAMPKMTGADLGKAIAKAFPGLPVILASGYAEIPGGSDLPRLPKPFSQADLSAAIARSVADLA